MKHPAIKFDTENVMLTHGNHTLPKLQNTTPTES